jgi:hypothetical protein
MRKESKTLDTLQATNECIQEGVSPAVRAGSTQFQYFPPAQAQLSQLFVVLH